MPFGELDPFALWILLLIIFGSLFIGATLLGLFFGRWRFKLKKKARKGCISFLYHLTKAGRIFTKPFAMMADWLSDMVVLLEMYQHGATNLMYLSILTLGFHLITSAFITFLDQPKYSKTRILQPILQLLNLRIIYEVWRSAKLGRATYNLNEIRLMEAIFESIPQMALQMYFLFQYGTGNFWESPMIMGSVICSVLNAATTLNYYDYYGLTSPESWFWRFWILLFRYSDIQLRTMTLGAIAYKYSARVTVGYFAVFSFISYVSTLCARHTSERRSLVQDLQITLLTCFSHDFYDDGLTRFFNIWKIVEKIVLVIILSEAFEYEIIKRILLVNTVIYLVTLLSIQYYCVLDVKKYKNVRDRNKEHLFKNKNYEVIIRLLKRKEIKLRDMRRFELKALIDHGLTIGELIQAGFKDEKLLEMGFTLEELYSEAAARRKSSTSRTPSLYLIGNSRNSTSKSVSTDKYSKKKGAAQKHQRALSAFMDDEDIGGRCSAELEKEGKGIGYLRCKLWKHNESVHKLALTYSLKALRKIRVSPKELLQLKDPEITLKKIVDTQYTIEPFEILELFSDSIGMSLEKLKEAGYPILDLLDGTLEKEDFLQYGISIDDWFRQNCSADDLKRAGYPKKEVAKYFPSSRPTNLETRNTFDINPFGAEPDSESSESYQVQRAITFTSLTVSPASTNMVPRESSTHTPKTNVVDGEVEFTEQIDRAKMEKRFVTRGHNTA